MSTSLSWRRLTVRSVRHAFEAQLAHPSFAVVLEEIVVREGRRVRGRSSLP